MPYDEQKFPAARVLHWPCATSTDRVTSPDSVTSVCYFQLPADPTVGGSRLVQPGLKP